MSEKVKPTLCDAILLTLCYREVFDYPMTRKELLHHLLFYTADEQALENALANMDGRQITLSSDYVLPIGNESILAVRETREHANTAYWYWAMRYAKWLRWVPFIRMVGITGSLAANNTDHAADIDLFCVTAANRMWLARCGMTVIKRITRRFCPLPACLNTCVSEAKLTLPDQNLYIAHQMALMAPVWGDQAYRRLLAANPWIKDYFPQLDFDNKKPIYEQSQPRLVRFIEWLLHGRMGALLNSYIHRIGARNALQGVQNDKRQSACNGRTDKPSSPKNENVPHIAVRRRRTVVQREYRRHNAITFQASIIAAYRFVNRANAYAFFLTPKLQPPPAAPRLP